jgi:hypothetical protein
MCAMIEKLRMFNGIRANISNNSYRQWIAQELLSEFLRIENRTAKGNYQEDRGSRIESRESRVEG